MRSKKVLCVLASLMLGICVNAQTRKPKFKKEDRRYNSWSVGVYGGVPLLQKADLISIGYDKAEIGYDTQIAVTKWVTHSLGLQVVGQMGKTKQHSKTGYGLNKQGYYQGHTDYKGISLLGVVNFNALFRRADNLTPMTWSIHAYAGIGLIAYDAEIRIAETGTSNEGLLATRPVHVPIGERSTFAQIGAGIKHKFAKNFDAEIKAMTVFTGDETFDGTWPADEAGEGATVLSDGPGRDLSMAEEDRNDTFYTLSLGVTYHFGKKEKLVWVDPFGGRLKASKDEMDEMKDDLLAQLSDSNLDLGDDDGDGVVNQFDTEPDTVPGAIVDGSGKALDIDQDGVFDGLDACPTEKGTVEHQGCPDPNKSIKETHIQKDFKVINARLQGIDFDLGKAIIKPQYFNLLNEVATVMADFPDANFYIYGHTDCRGTASNNQRLSLRRANSVKKYLASKGISLNRLTSIGKGEREPINACLPCTACSESEHLINRRIEFTEDRPLIKIEESK